jgi:hypothetical protein
MGSESLLQGENTPGRGKLQLIGPNSYHFDRAGDPSPFVLQSSEVRTTVIIRMLGAALLIVSLSTGAIARQPDAFDACAREQDPAQRLACFDRETAARHATEQAPAPATPTREAPAPKPAAASASAPASSASSDIGLDARQLRKARRERGEPEPPPPAPIVARVVRVIPREPLISAFELDNGQIWEQSEATRFSAMPRDEVTIRHGMLGSFFLKGAHGTSVRVHRLK